MNPELAIEVVKALIVQALNIATPILVTAMMVGLAVSVFQAVTSIHEQTLAFVPKVVGIASVIIITLPWVVRSLMQFTTLLIQKMPEMVR
jgi:flagellar biosynthesis protein FliQ